MKSEDILNAIGNIDDKLISDAANGPPIKNSNNRIKWVSVAVCFVLIAVAVPIFNRFDHRGSISPFQTTQGTASQGGEDLPIYTATTAQPEITVVTETTAGEPTDITEPTNNPDIGGSDYTFAREFVDEVYNIHIVSEIVGNQALQEWVDNVYLKLPPEEMNALPDLYRALRAFNITKEQVIEQNGDRYHPIPDYIIDALYLDDINEMKRLLTNPYALYHDGNIYTFDRLLQAKDVENYSVPQNVLSDYLDFVEQICIEEQIIKYMQEDINSVRKKFGIEY